MLTLITFPPSFSEPSHSPFCAKAMILLQMSGQTWEREDLANPSAMPHGRLPVLRAKGQLIPDSEFIQGWLTTQGADFFPDCTDEQKAIGHSVIKMVEETLRNALIHDRWLDDQNWAYIGPLFFDDVPRPIRKLIAGIVRRSVRAGLKSNGFARMSLEQRLQKVENDLNALGQIKGASPFILGDAPTAVDAAVLPVLSMIDRLPVETALTRVVRSKDWVGPYLQRGRSTLYDGLA
ncbi:glutathione S-transferase family protein [Phaeobacter gallaeciensis]|uniref:Glutathione S-transferase n=2 Tax=Phaeobacter gallaeciensis TaxID=60890 RepID=A0AAC9Z840_9RHOB|nr:glutathione S-transferase family protein [Phaeobacter gallaeciensis]AHD09040.1 Glutathione S-transferase [Phaeobacter gallaeciensis DSM 26640]ATE92306.1 Glutathione S-transferase [Phaeobacter gallaeciensis]ATE97875.1 Glutathione S-transferase [Phaeobacter gallaeciensis]ATF00968.1 Glutathione S-transferase [Phaeobacter gallaeciensis]ATF05348.1 Glutathione S-transferase [Phaeobacter gallaeciensis]